MKIKIQPGLDHITDRADLLQDFVVFVCKDLQCMPCPIDIVNGRKGAGLKTTAQYDTQNHHVMVNAKNRHFGDVLRSIAHELVHHKQNLNGELDAPVQDVGGDIEDEANARAGAMLKSFAYQKGPERIYENLLREQEEEKKEKKIPGYFPTPEEKQLAKMKTFLTPGFTEEFYKQANRIGASPTHLATVINLETGGAWSPETRPYPFHTRKEIEAARKQGRKLKPKGKPVSSAHGLIQFMRKTRKEMKELLEVLIHQVWQEWGENGEQSGDYTTRQLWNEYFISPWDNWSVGLNNHVPGCTPSNNPIESWHETIVDLLKGEMRASTEATLTCACMSISADNNAYLTASLCISVHAESRMANASRLTVTGSQYHLSTW